MHSLTASLDVLLPIAALDLLAGKDVLLLVQPQGMWNNKQVTYSFLL